MHKTPEELRRQAELLEYVRDNRKLLVEARLNSGFTQQDMADKVGYNIAVICRFEQGASAVSLYALDRIVPMYKALLEDATNGR